MRSIILQPNEEIVTVFRQSPAVLGPRLLIALVLVIAPLWYLVRYELYATLGIWLLLWVVLVAMWFSKTAFHWQKEKYIVTTVRFVKSTHESVFKQSVTETALDRILNVSFRSTGPWSMMTGFGDVDVQVVGMLEPIVVKSVRQPGVVKEFLWRLHEKSLEGGNAHSMRNEYAKPNQPLA